MIRETGREGDHGADGEQHSHTVTVDVFQTFRGDRSTDDRAADANDLRHQVRRRETETLTHAEFCRLYDHVGSDTVPTEPNPDDLTVASAIWARWNRGSSAESRAFREAETRSLEVGDVVSVEGTLFLCTPRGWNEIELGEDA